MFPVFHILGFTIPVEPLAALLAFTVGSEVGSRMAGSSADDAEMAVAWSEAFTAATFYALLAGLVGARLGYALHYFELYLAEPSLFLSLRPGTLAIVPGSVVGVVVAIFYIHRSRVPVSVVSDAGAVAALTALVAWNVGQFFTGDGYGVPGNVPWTIPL